MGAAPLVVGVSFLPSWEQISGFITGAGFSVFVAVWFMLAHDRKVEALTEAIKELRITLAVIAGGQGAPRSSGMRGEGEAQRREGF